VLLIACALMFSCAENHQAAEMADLKLRVAELNRQVTDAHVRIEDLNNRVFILQEQLENQPTAFRERPPGNLKQVKLVPKKQEAKPANTGNSLTLTPKNDYNNQVKNNSSVLISNWPPSGPIVEKDSRQKEAGIIQREYERALKLYREKQYNQAIVAFGQLIKRHKANSYTDNAVFWTGVCYVEQNEYTLAIAEFKKILGFKKSNKRADAMYYLGICFRQNGDEQSAVKYWKQIISEFPKSDAADKARAKIN